ncbi:MAG: hypothetical protein HY074_00685 [Deltaproteobacteria bacterium]|nr:hypothetical protein [Deltaproteobacteria bacterium]
MRRGVPNFAHAVLIAWSLAAAATVAVADDCTPVDMRNSGGPMENIQPMSQGEHGTCYAYAAAELADSWACAHLSPRTPESLRTMPRTSPIALSIDTRVAGIKNGNGGKQNCAASMSCTGMSPLDGGAAADCIDYLRSRSNAACDHRQAFGVSKVSFQHFTPVQADDPTGLFPPGQYWEDKEDTVTKSGLGMGGNFSAGRHVGARELEVSFAGRDSDYLKAVMKAYDDLQERLRHPINDGTDTANAMSLKLTCDLLSAGVPDENMVGKTASVVNPALADVFRKGSNDTKLEFLKRYFGSLCSGKTFGFAPSLPAMHKETFYPEDGKHDVNKIVGYLNSRLGQPGGFPVEIGYCASVLYGGDKFTGLNPTGPVDVEKKDGDRITKDSTRCLRKVGTEATGNTTPTAKKETAKKGMVGDPSDHSSLIVGRKRDATTGACMFLVRNSWGASCERYAGKEKGYECETGTGDLWIDAAKLASAIQDVSHFTP